MLLLPALLCAVLAMPSNQSAPVETSERRTDAPQEADVNGNDKPATPAHTGFRALVAGLGSDIAHLP